jgi:CheY-like chemotaxis protein
MHERRLSWQGSPAQLPVCFRILTSEDMETKGSGAPGLQGIQVLVIDDSPGVLDVLTTLLRLEGADAVGVANGRDALSALRAHDFDVVMSDLGLPDIPGDVLIRAILDSAPRPPHVIVITGDSGPAVIRAKEAGASVIFTKPCDWAEVVTYLNDLELVAVASAGSELVRAAPSRAALPTSLAGGGVKVA